MHITNDSKTATSNLPLLKRPDPSVIGSFDPADTASWQAFAERLGAGLRRRRHELGLSQQAVADAAGITRYHYQQLEKGRSRPDTPGNPSLRITLRILLALDTDMEQLIS